ncbi:MAG: SGNH/GDSL hydrolase family protein [Isosphaeraceae bacterium]
MSRTSMRNVVRKGVDSYKACALFFFNIVVVFAMVNIAIFAAYTAKDAARGRPTPSNNVINLLGMSTLREIYRGYQEDDIRLLLQETWDRGLQYDPYTQYKERAYAGKWVNVDKTGFRLSKNNGPWPPDPKNLNVFLFGGSTTFGYGVADDQTIATHLQEFLEGKFQRHVKVYNFGSGCFFSTQERTRFMNFLAEGIVPDVAVFIDGLNDFLMSSGEPLFTFDMGKLWDDRELKRSSAGSEFLSLLPMKRVIDAIHSRVAGDQQEKLAPNSKSPDDSKKLADVLNRYSQNRRLIDAAARACNVRPAFVWQPIPSYHYNVKHYRGDPNSDWLRAATASGYAIMARTVKEAPEDCTRNFLWLADIQQEFTKSLYVDSFHYTDEFSKVIAHHIGRFLLERKIIEDRK